MGNGEDGTGDSGPGALARSRLLVAHERRRLRSLALWVARRRDGVGAGDTAVGYARAQAPTSYGLVFVFALETAGVSFMLAPYPVAHLVMLVLDLYVVLLALGLHAAAVTRPHVVGSTGVRVRHRTSLDLWIPAELIDSVREELRFPDANRDREGVLDAAVAGQTSVTLELVRPVTVVGAWGGRTRVRTVCCHADEPRAAVAAIRKLLPAAL
ncbi:hypothetical protein ABZW32_18650 [Streptomyces sp. NPDC004667]|uniref:hypothetical protein n=1 Tax=Streptomyces sp. NPDC004667 TaxID=3154285 RepID=UPI0033A0B721